MRVAVLNLRLGPVVTGRDANCDAELRCRQQAVIDMIDCRRRPQNRVVERLVFVPPPADRQHAGIVGRIIDNGAEAIDEALLVERQK